MKKSEKKTWKKVTNFVKKKIKKWKESEKSNKKWKKKSQTNVKKLQTTQRK